MIPARLGLIGCGKVSHMYLPVLMGMSSVDVVAVADVDPVAARAVAGQYGIPAVQKPEELLANPGVEIVLNLTPIAAHVDTTLSALAAGKHVYSEKPLARTVSEARGIVAEAERMGLVLACAPDTLLGTGFQTGWQALAAGAVGRPLAASAAMFRTSLERPTFYTNGTTPFFDMGPYYLTALVAMFGPATSVSGATRTWPEGEKPVEPAAGASISLAGVVEFASGLLANVLLAWGTGHRGEVTDLVVHGSSGVLHLPNPNNFGDPAYVHQYGSQDRTELPGSRQPEEWAFNLRGLGVADMAHAIRHGQKPRANADLACHVVDLIAGLTTSAETGRRVRLGTTCDLPEPMPAGVREQLLT